MYLALVPHAFFTLPVFGMVMTPKCHRSSVKDHQSEAFELVALFACGLALPQEISTEIWPNQLGTCGNQRADMVHANSSRQGRMDSDWARQPSMGDVLSELYQRRSDDLGSVCSVDFDFVY